MKPKTVRKYRRMINTPGYWEERIEFVRKEARWYREEYAIRHHSWDLHEAERFERLLPWLKKKANEAHA